MLPGIAGAIAGWVAPSPFSYRNSYSDTTNTSTYSFASCDIGDAHPLRLVVVGIKYNDNQPAVSSATVGGISATLAVTSGAQNRSAELWYALVPTGLTATIEVNGGGTYTACAIHVWAGYPASSTPVDAVGTSAASGDITITDLAKTAGGFACFVSGTSTNAATGTLTQTGAETITENFEGSLDASDAHAAMSFIVTATTTADDFTRTWTGASGRGIAGATWL